MSAWIFKIQVSDNLLPGEDVAADFLTRVRDVVEVMAKEQYDLDKGDLGFSLDYNLDD